MTVRRFAIYLALLVLLALAGVALVFWALYAGSPPPLGRVRERTPARSPPLTRRP